MTDAQEQIYRAADHFDDQGTRKWDVDGRGMPQARHLGCDILQIQGLVWRDERFRRPEAAGFVDRECSAEAIISGCDARQRGSERPRNKKLLTPDVKRQNAFVLVQYHAEGDLKCA